MADPFAFKHMLLSLGSRFRRPSDVPPPVSEVINKTKDELSNAISEVIAAIESERVIIRALEAQMIELQLSHQDGSHREIYKEIDELRVRLEQLEGGPAATGAGTPVQAGCDKRADADV